MSGDVRAGDEGGGGSTGEAAAAVGLSAEDLLDVVGAYRLAAAVRAMADLGIPELLAVEPMSAQELAARLRVDPAVLDRLLRMLAARGALVSVGDRRYANSGLAEALIDPETKAMVLGWVAAPSLLAAWGQIATAMRAGTSAFEAAFGCDRETLLDRQPAERDAYVAAMGSTVEGFEAIAAALELADGATVVCVGGGQGIELVPILRRWPKVLGVLVDLPSGLRGADEVLEQHHVRDRVRIVPGDARVEVPEGDAYVLSTVLRCLSDEDALDVLETCHRSARPGATLHVVEMPLPDHLDARSATADLTAWVAYGGADRTIAQWSELLSRAGWRHLTLQSLNEPFVMLTSRAR